MVVDHLQVYAQKQIPDLQTITYTPLKLKVSKGDEYDGDTMPSLFKPSYKIITRTDALRVFDYLSVFEVKEDGHPGQQVPGHGMTRPFSSTSGKWKHPTSRPIPLKGTIVRILASGELGASPFPAAVTANSTAPCNRPVRHLPTGRNPPRRWNWKPTCGNTAKPLVNTSTTSDHERLQRTRRTICMGVQRRMPDLPDHGRYLCHRTRPTALLLRL